MTPITLQKQLGKKDPFSCPEEEAYLNLRRTFSLLDHQSEQYFKSNGLSHATYNVLRILRGLSRQSDKARAPAKVRSSDIARWLVSAVPDLTRLVDRLIGEGLVERTRCEEDRRVVFVGITRKGLQRLAKIDKSIADQNRILLGHLSRRELETLNRLLVKARSSVETNTQPDRSS